ncbi:MAG: CsbD-like [Actinomycetota bacterium]|jgi:uncharacterized protein YjbJ (UPF0337 family)
MNENTDTAKGKIKQAVADLTDDKDLKREGKLDVATGKTKEAIDAARDKISPKKD